MKGALVEFASSFGALVPSLIVFQFNPETLRHNWTQSEAVAGGHPLAVSGPPGESFSFALAMDVTDQIIDGNAIAEADGRINGIYARLAALEKLMFPIPVIQPDDDRAVPALQLATVLFVWGPGRIVPVRVSSLTITETLFDPLLNPTHADAQLELKVLTPAELDAASGPLKRVAQAAYDYTMAKRDLLALVNLNNAAGSFDLPPLPGL